MEYGFLSPSCGLKVSKVALGTMTFGGGAMPGQCDEPAAHAILDAYAAAGGNFIDTADVYSGGESERIVGRWLQTVARDTFVIATKLRFQSGAAGDPNAVGLSRKHVRLAVEASLARLQTPYVDLLQLHCWDAGTPVEETVRALAELVGAGKVMYVGASNVTGWQLQKLVMCCRAHGVPLATLQAQYSLLCRQTEWELQPCAAAEGIGLLPWSPLKGGWLAGKVRRGGAPAAGTRVGWAQATKPGLQSAPDYDALAGDERTWALLDGMVKIAARRGGKSVAQVALRWLMQREAVASVVIGAKTLEQLHDNLGATTWELADADVAQLDALSDVPVPYPWEMVGRCQGGRTRQ